MYTYNCVIKKIVDGDTVDVDIDLGFGVWLSGERVRLHGIDTPESRTSDQEEKYYGQLATEFVEKHLEVGERYMLRSKKFNSTDSFGRILGDFIVNDDKSMVDLLLESHHAVHWNSSNREGMKQQHIANRRILAEQGLKP